MLTHGTDRSERRRRHAIATGAAHRAPRSSLVLGFGNVLLGDDGAGIQLLEQLRGTTGSADTQFIDGGTMSFSLLPYVEAAGSLLVTDAAELGWTPGSVALFEGDAMDEFLRSGRRRTVHEVGITDLLDMARLGDCLPDQRALLCIQPGLIDWGQTLSVQVSAALPEAARQAGHLLDRWNLA